MIRVVNSAEHYLDDVRKIAARYLDANESEINQIARIIVDLSFDRAHLPHRQRNNFKSAGKQLDLAAKRLRKLLRLELKQVLETDLETLFGHMLIASAIKKQNGEEDRATNPVPDPIAESFFSDVLRIVQTLEEAASLAKNAGPRTLAAQKPATARDRNTAVTDLFVIFCDCTDYDDLEDYKVFDGEDEGNEKIRHFRNLLVDLFGLLNNMKHPPIVPTLKHLAGILNLPK